MPLLLNSYSFFCCPVFNISTLSSSHLLPLHAMNFCLLLISCSCQHIRIVQHRLLHGNILLIMSIIKFHRRIFRLQEAQAHSTFYTLDWLLFVYRNWCLRLFCVCKFNTFRIRRKPSIHISLCFISLSFSFISVSVQLERKHHIQSQFDAQTIQLKTVVYIANYLVGGWRVNSH